MLEVAVRRDGATGFVDLDGELDPETAPLLIAKVRTLVDAGVERLEVDCAGLTFLDSSGVNVLVGAWKALQSRSTMPIVVDNTKPNVRRILEICGLDQVMVIR